MKRAVILGVVLLSGMASVAFGADSTKVNGWISDSMCGAKYAGTGAACAKKCIEGGSKPVFVDEAKKQVWTIDNPDAVKDAYGKHVSISATENLATKSVHVTAVAVLPE